MKKHGKNIKKIVILLLVLFLVNVLATLAFKRFDLTKNKRYTISEPAKNIIREAEEPILISVFLKGDLPSNFKRLENETRYLLEEFGAYNRDIKFKFFNPLEETEEDAEQIGQRFFQNGMPPQRISEKKDGKSSQRIVFPWAVATLGEESVEIPLLKQNPEDDEEDLVTNSVQGLEYAFVNAFKQLTSKKSKNIAVMRSKGELEDRYITDFLKSLGAYYNLAPFVLDSVETNPQETLKQLQKFDLILEAKPTQPFSEKEKYILDQYLMNGGKALWAVDAVAAEKDSLFIDNQNIMLAFPRDLKLTEFFFSYGIRIQPSLVNDLHADNLILASGQGNDTQFDQYPWYYSPLVVSESKHPIAHNIHPVRFDFANPMDTLKNDIKKEVLLKSSVATKVEGTPLEISLNKTINEKPDFETYNSGQQNLAVLLEGKFNSVYQGRVKPLELADAKEKSEDTKMMVISDGDILKNEVNKGEPMSLEYNQYTGKSYGNKEFLLNTINYMLDDSNLLDIRSKEVKIAFLDTDKIKADRFFWQILNIGLPLLIIAIFGLGFKIYRKKKYA